MSIISVRLLDSELPSDANDNNGDETYAVAQASAFVNTWATHYDPFDDYTTEADSPYTEVFNAPSIIVRECLEIAKAMYYMRVGQIYMDGEEKRLWADFLSSKEKSLMRIQIEPEWKSQPILLNSCNSMVIGSRSSLGTWPRVIPQTAQVVSASNNTWIPPNDWYIRMGGSYSGEYPDAWYFYASSSKVEGTLRYMRTFRNDGYDYARYGES